MRLSSTSLLRSPARRWWREWRRKEHEMTLQKNPGAVRRFARLSRVGAWLQNLPNKIVPPPFRLMQISASYWQSRALYVAARLDIATALADGELGVEEIATRVQA